MNTLTFGSDDSCIYDGELSPNGNLIALHSGLARLKEGSETTWRITESAFTVIRTDTGTVLHRSDSETADYVSPSHFAFDPRDELLAVSCKTGVAIFRLDPWRKLTEFKSDIVGGPVAWNGRADTVAVADSNREIVLLHFDRERHTLTPIRRLTLPSHAEALYFDACFEILYTETQDEKLYKVRLEPGLVHTADDQDIRAKNHQIYYRLRRLKEVDRQMLPLEDPYIYRADRIAANVMTRRRVADWSN